MELVCGANIRRDVKISHSAVKQKVLNVSSGITVLQGGEDVKQDTKMFCRAGPNSSAMQVYLWEGDFLEPE